MSAHLKPQQVQGSPYEGFLRDYHASKQEELRQMRSGVSVGNQVALRGGGPGFRTSAQMNTEAKNGPTGREPPPCPKDPTVPDWGGICVCGPGECEYDPAVFCGWSALPFSTFKNQGDAPELSGPILATFGSERTIRITAERACLFRIRGIWFQSLDENDCTSVGVSLLASVEINKTPRLIEIGSIAPTERIGIPSAMFNTSYWVLPTDFGILSPINNVSRPMELIFITPCQTNQEIIGVLFGDPITDTGQSAYGNYMLCY